MKDPQTERRARVAVLVAQMRLAPPAMRQALARRIAVLQAEISATKAERRDRKACQ